MIYERKECLKFTDKKIHIKKCMCKINTFFPLLSCKLTDKSMQILVVFVHFKHP